MSDKLSGMIYDIQPFSIQDGPGIRTTVFLKGCPLRCPWCHSPESQEFAPQLSWIALKCVGCGSCAPLCPKSVIRYAREEEPPHRIQSLLIDRERCDNCGLCTAKCYPKALSLCGRVYTVDEVMEKVLGDMPFYENSGGGVTISGGEPLCQAEFTLALLQALKSAGIHTAVDTTGYVPESAVRSVLPYTDLFLYDLKLMDSQKHQATVGVPNERILRNLEIIADSGGRVQVRIPLIPGVNDAPENLRLTGEFCARFPETVTSIQLLPYHSFGVSKYARIGRDEKGSLFPEISDDAVNAAREILLGCGLNVTVH